jgi:hypothetical protein
MSFRPTREPLPDFVVIGVQKSGTTWLTHLLRQHPEVYMPDREIHFFDKVHNYRKGEEWYRRHFSDATARQTIGEKTPDYIWANGDGVEGHHPDVHKNLHTHLPEAKLIVLLRNPVDRAISAVKHIIRSGRVSPRHSLDDLLVGDKHDLVSGHGVLEYGYYSKHLGAYLDLFSRSQILLLFFEEDVVEAPREGFEKALRFLDLPRSEEVEGIQEKVNADKMSLLEMYVKYHVPRLVGVVRRLRPLFPWKMSPPSEKTITWLYDHYADHNRQLAELLDRPLPESWKASDAEPASA